MGEGKLVQRISTHICNNPNLILFKANERACEKFYEEEDLEYYWDALTRKYPWIQDTLKREIEQKIENVNHVVSEIQEIIIQKNLKAQKENQMYDRYFGQVKPIESKLFL